MYAEYSYYVSNYFGTDIAEADWNKLATRASDFIDYFTRGKASSYADSDSVKKCCCALAERYQVIETSRASASKGNGEMQSQTVGNYSVTYRSGAEVTQAEKQQFASICFMYLGNLVYRGGKVVCSACSNSL